MRQRETLIAILVILVAAAVVVPRSMPRPGRQAVEGFLGCGSNLKSLRIACEMMRTANGRRFPVSLAELTPRYLGCIPTCPAAGTDTYSPSFASASDPEAYTFFCQGDHHADVGCGRNQPRCTTRAGPDDDGLAAQRARTTQQCHGRPREQVLAWMRRNGIRITREAGPWARGEGPSHMSRSLPMDYVFSFNGSNECDRVGVNYHDDTNP